MKLTKDQLAQLYQQQTARQPHSACPATEELTQAAMGEMGEAERGRLADHLLGCRDCAGEYQLALSLQSWALTAAAELQPAAKTEAQLAPAPVPLRVVASEPKPGWSERLRGWFSLPALGYAMAVPLLLVSLALIGWIASLRRENAQLAEAARHNAQQASQNQLSADEAARRAQQSETQIADLRKNIEELSQPQINVPITDLMPRESSRGQGNDEVQRIDLPAGTNLFTVILNVTGQPNFADYALEVLDAQGQVVYQGRGLRKSAENTFTVALHQRLLPAGQYQFKLYGLNKGQRTLVQNYRVQLRAQ